MKKLISIIVFFLISITYLITTSEAIALALPEINSQAPDFQLNGYSKENKSEKKWSLTDFNGSWLVLYFYPKDFTSGCTLEAKGFNTYFENFKDKNAKIVGISADSEIDHKSFCNSQDLKYLLLSDPSGLTSQNYGSWQKPYSLRNTFLIDPTGKIKFRWIGVSPLNHSKNVLDKLIEVNT